MKFQYQKEKVTGVALPLSAVRTRSNGGYGEFPDIKLLGHWAARTGQKIIQLLPLNDTETDSSPYNSISAFALSPVYIKLEEIRGTELVSEKISTLKTRFSRFKRNSHSDFYTAKIELLLEIYENQKGRILKEKSLVNWINKNKWIIPYSVYKHINFRKKNTPWNLWGKYSQIDEKQVIHYWSENKEEAYFYAWIQYIADKQFRDANRFLERKGIYLKGDIPILMNRNSCDVWYHRNYFHLDTSAGTPPDPENPDGQNWGFPTYHWENMEADNFKWWVSRMKHFNRYYHLIRLDHILGFFRIWNIPDNHHSGSQGYYNPYCYIYQTELEKVGFNSARIFWLSEPHIRGEILRKECGDWLTELKRDFLDQVNSEDLYVFKKGMNSQKEIWNSQYPEPIKASLDMFVRNRALIPLGDGVFFPSWYYTGSQSWQSLNGYEKHQLEKLMSKKYEAAEQIWKTHAHKILSVLTSEADMQFCAEDLGAMSPVVPGILQSLDILSLKVIRWNRRYNEPRQPFIKPENYPYHSVCTTSVHDSSSFRQWWKESDDIDEFKIAFHLNRRDNGMERNSFERILSHIIRVNSGVLILPIQDWLQLWPEILPKNPEEDRINTPGSVNDRNWSYRLPVNMELILDNKNLNSTIKKYTRIRKREKRL